MAGVREKRGKQTMAGRLKVRDWLAMLGCAACTGRETQLLWKLCC